jgi:ubiquinone/menaquinone biosynthesis C-methylase UbiE
VTTFDRDARSAYEAAAAAWAGGPVRVYRRLAEALLHTAPVPVDGALLIDIGAGTGVVGDLATDLGARCVDVDVAVEMLAHRGSRPRRAVAADGRRLPFRPATCDIVTAACSLSHVEDPVATLRELRRILRPGGTLLASAFPPATTPHPVRACVEDALTEFGYRHPSWYEHLKDNGERRVETAEALAELGHAARFDEIEVHRLQVDTCIASPDALVDYRLGMAQHVQFLAGLDDRTRHRIRATAIARLGQSPPPLTLGLLVLSARA